VLSARVLRLLGLEAAHEAGVTGAVRRSPDPAGDPERCPVCGMAVVPGECVVAVRGHPAHAACAETRAGAPQAGRWR
jgi:hypothetical protein